ncbi:unknow [Vibrio campbellii]|nr:unknow [Vibrio campbellii]
MGVIIQKSEYPCQPSERGKKPAELKKISSVPTFDVPWCEDTN